MFGTWFRYACSEGVPQRSFIAAVIVGMVLNLINQGDRLFTGDALHWGKIALTFCVPYCVATYGAVSFRLRHERDQAENTENA